MNYVVKTYSPFEMCHLYFSRYKLFNYKYVHIVKPNVLYLNKDFFFDAMTTGSVSTVPEKCNTCSLRYGEFVAEKCNTCSLRYEEFVAGLCRD